MAVFANHRLGENKYRSHGTSSQRGLKLICLSVARFFAKGKQYEIKKDRPAESDELKCDKTQDAAFPRPKVDRK
jgi:hypothetical protein